MGKVIIRGLPQLTAKLKRLQKDTAKEIVPALGAAAQQITELMRRQVSVDDGTLRDSIGWTFGEAPQGSIKIATRFRGLLTVTIYAGSREAFYARWIEFGTAPHPQGGRFTGTQHPGTRSRPFFFPSFRAMRKEVKRRLTIAVRDAVRKAVK